ncbi:CotY/CotZ family spore coat protein [Pontibacillus yanchengensis]|uniref:Spore coat protein n=1 Tax=Pontibacillus yanchengensis Y32 TaxID=1385514 RepID=A0A0A2TYN5_9BACI|nr:CotY/CotZ family spore coat protein [Pontibacillus yanchengensis]KGP74335.1 spore coat protein [Pontibacillus yanchengensis Y32]
MGCGKKFDSGDCVRDILKEIVAAQNDVADDVCDSSCEQSINDLLGDTGGNNGLDTVPVLLYCKDCKPFKGFGALRGNGRGSVGELMCSFFFRVNEVDDDCALLELLVSDDHDDHDHKDKHDSPKCQDISDLRATGICITVDLDCFCHITCLPAINAIR